MAVILIRHAEAEDDSPRGDAYRALTPQGFQQARDTAAWLAEFASPLPSVLFASPLVRTTQTAETLIATWGTGTLTLHPALRPGQSLEVAAQLARASPQQGLVGHQPMMGELAAELIGRAVLPFSFERGAALVLEPGPTNALTFRGYRAPFGQVIRKL